MADASMQTGGAVQLAEINHFTIRCRPNELKALRAFYRDVLGMREGQRPPFDFPGCWMYIGDKAVVHLAGIATGTAPSERLAHQTGFDHISLSATGLAATRAHLSRLHISYEELPVPGWPLHQIFLRDPAGTKLELTFRIPE